MLRDRMHRPNAGSHAAPPAIASNLATRPSAPNATARRATTRRRWVGTIGALVALAGAAALLEWAGWRIHWRHGGGRPLLDAAWRAAFLGGAFRTVAGALATGGMLALVTRAIAARLAWAPPRARRAAVRAFIGGAGGLLVLLGALTLWAP